MSNLQTALKYLKLGFSVIPVGSNKKALFKWKEYQLKRPSQEKVKEWWGKYPSANIAIITGEVSGVDVVDCDTEESYKMMNDEFIPDSFQTPVVKTPKGYHIYFKHKEGLSNEVRAINGTDLRTTGGYVIAPPSKNGNGIYRWFDGLSPKDVDFKHMPDILFDILQQSSSFGTNRDTSNYINNNIALPKTSNSTPSATFDHTNHKQPQKPFEKGSRDNDIFHLANCLVKGRCNQVIMEKTLEIIAKNCNPPFSEKEIPIKIKSALDRDLSRNSTIAQDVRDFITTTNGNISTTNCHKILGLTTNNHKKAANMALLRFEKEGLIEKTGRHAGEYRIIDQDVTESDWLNATEEYTKIWLPLGLCNLTGENCIVQVCPGDIILFAGTPNVGKSGMLMNIAKENRGAWNVHYISSELSPAKFRLRLSKDEYTTLDMLKEIKFYDLSNSRNKNFQDYIRQGRGNLNIFDYVESLEEPWKMGVYIDEIFRKLKGAVGVIAVQKKPGAETGYGGTYVNMRPSLVVNLEYKKEEGTNEAQIVKCKQPDDRFIEEIGNPEYMKCKYKLVKGIRVMKEGVWLR